MNWSRSFGSTWAGSCVGSVGGSLYFALVVLQILGDEGSLEAFVVVFLFGMIISFPGLLVGSLLVGSRVTRVFADRFRINLALLFAMVGCLFGVLVAAVLAAVDHFLVAEPFIFGVGPRHVAALLLSVPVFYLTLSGWMVGLHAARLSR